MASRGSGREAEQPRASFYYDFNSPYSYLAAERIAPVFAEAGAEQPEWVPISFGHLLRTTGRRPWSIPPEGPDPEHLAEVQRRADERGLPEVVYAKGWPVDNYSLLAPRAATFAKQSGKAVSFSQAAFRQHFAGGRDLSDIDNVLIAAAACELHPKAVIKGIETEAVKTQLREATEAAIEKGVEGIPTVDVGGELFWGDDQLEIAAAKAASRAE